MTSIAVRSGLSNLQPFALRRGRKDGRALASRELEHIFVIAGPSGSGKSTFMREFVENRLPSEIAADLPQAARLGTAPAATS